MAEHSAVNGALAREQYIEAALVACPRCRAAVGKPCTEVYCENGYRNCEFAVCARRRETDQPHLERSVRSRQARVTPPVSTEGGAL